MADPVREILSSSLKHREKVAALAAKAGSDAETLAGVVELLKTGSDIEKGTAAEVCKFVSHDNPDALAPYIDLLIAYIDYRAPRVRWGCPEALGNLARRYPEQVEKAVPKLLGNLEDGSTVVRWCAAYALAEIAKHSAAKQPELAALFGNLIASEPNNGVRGVYSKALKEIRKHPVDR